VIRPGTPPGSGQPSSWAGKSWAQRCAPAKSVVDGRLGSVEGGGVAEEQVVAVGFVEQGVGLEGELPGVGLLRQVALLLSREDVGLQ
jgi:hypothetical protein